MKVENLKVYDLEESLVASGYPLSEGLDSKGKAKQKDVDRCFSLLKESVDSATDNQWLSGITVAFDLTCTNVMWSELDKYNLFKVASQVSHDALLNLDNDDLFNNFVDSRIIVIIKEKVEKYIDLCNNQPVNFNDVTWESEKEKLRNKIIYSIPSGIEITSRVKADYKSLMKIYLDNSQTKNQEWMEFCCYLLKLPLFKLLLDNYKKGEN